MTEIQFCKLLCFLYIERRKIYGSYFLQSPLCFIMDVIMSKNKGVFL